MRSKLLYRSALHLLPLLLAGVLLVVPAQGQNKKQLERDKAKIEKEIARLNNELAKARKTSKNSTKQISLIKSRIQERTRLIDNINGQMNLLDRQIVRTEDSLRVVRGQIDNMKSEYARVVRSLPSDFTTMKKIKLMVISMTVMMMAAVAPAAAQPVTQNVQQLERDIEQHEKNIKEKENAIKDLEERIDNMKSQLKDLESQKKTLEKDLKAEIKTRKDKFTTRDELVYDQEIADVFYNPYNKADVEEALDSFEGMETKDVIKKKELVEKYGEYTKDMKEFMEKMKKQLAANKWKYLSSSTDLYKKFENGLKGTKYWKVYNKKEKNESIDYLDRVMDKIMLFKNDGLKNESQFNEILNMLYAN